MLTKKLSKIEVECGLIRFGAKYCDMFPEKGGTVVMIDSKGREYVTHIHRTVNRIDGLTAMHRNNNAATGTTIIVEKIKGHHNTYRVNYGN